MNRQAETQYWHKAVGTSIGVDSNNPTPTHQERMDLDRKVKQDKMAFRSWMRHGRKVVTVDWEQALDEMVELVTPLLFNPFR